MAYALQKAAPEATIKLLAAKGAGVAGSVVSAADVQRRSELAPGCYSQYAAVAGMSS